MLAVLFLYPRLKMFTEFYKLNCKNTFTPGNKVVCKKCLKFETFYKLFIDNKDELEEFVDVLERPFPFENNQEHQEQSAAHYKTNLKTVQNCLFSKDIDFWKTTSLKIGNLIYKYRRDICKNNVIIKISAIADFDFLNEIRWDITTFDFYKIVTCNEEKVFQTFDCDFDSFTPSICKEICNVHCEDVDIFYEIKSLLKKNCNEDFLMRVVNEQIAIYYCFMVVYGPALEDFFYWTGFVE